MIHPALHSIPHHGATLHAETLGEGPTVTLLHGGLGHLGTMGGLRRPLVEAGYRVLAMDSRGMGRSGLGDGPLSYGQHERDVVAVWDALGVERSAVVGFSDGGITGLRLAARGDGRVGALATVGSRWRAEDSAHLWEAFPTLDRAKLADGPQAQLLEDYDRLSPDQDFDRLAELYSTLWKDAGPDGHPAEAVDAITAPTLLAVGDGDPFVPVAPVLELHHRLTERELPCQLLVLPGAGHAAHDERADLFLPALLTFLARHATS